MNSGMFLNLYCKYIWSIQIWIDNALKRFIMICFFIKLTSVLIQYRSKNDLTSTLVH
jgi:hypothetical protein